MLVAEISKLKRLSARIPDGAADVDLTLIKLPANALIFPAIPGPGEDFDFAKPRNPRNFSKEFARRAEVIGFGRVLFHDFRGVHSTALLDAGIPVHRVAERIRDDPAVLLRNYAKRKRAEAGGRIDVVHAKQPCGGFSRLVRALGPVWAPVHVASDRCVM
jgi:integrase